MNVATQRLKEDAWTVLCVGLAAVAPEAAIRRTLRLEGDRLLAGGSEHDLERFDRILLLAAGKAAPAMVRGAMEVLGVRVAGGLVTTKHGHATGVQRLETVEAGHPVPDAAGQVAAERALRLARRAGERDLVLCLLSGGASALWPAPVEGVSLAELQSLTNDLLRAGADIRQLNTVRKHLSRIAGGRLAEAAYPATVVTLLISDVVGSPLEVIASGPTVPDPTTYTDALRVLEDLGVTPPAAVNLQLHAGMAGKVPETPKQGNLVFERASAHVIANNRDALEAAAREAEQLGYRSLVVTTRLEGEASEAGRLIARVGVGMVQDGLPLEPPAALLFGGETTVTVRGDGLGGRNQEMVVAAATVLEGTQGVVLACLGTDGTDGPTDAAGGLVDGTSLQRGHELGLDAHEYLRRNDSYTWLRATGDLLATGPTGTNVNDIYLVLAG